MKLAGEVFERNLIFMKDPKKKRHSGKKKMKIWKKILLVLIIIIVAIIIAFAAYIGKYYHADVDLDDYLGQMGTVTTTEMGQGLGHGDEVDGLFLDGEGNAELVIFYPGAKVEYTSYLPLFHELASNGVDCYLVDMPGNLAFFGMDAAEQIMDQLDGYDNYYLAGHSLGGAMGASFAADYIQASDQLKGMIFLAAYSTESLDKDGFKVLSIYGSEDQVLSMDKVEEGRALMPTDYTEVCIEGGNHAQFGNYGEQKGDGQSSIDADSQQTQTVEAILSFIFTRYAGYK